MKENEVAAILTILYEIYPNRIGSGDERKTLSVWSAVLAQADPKAILSAATAYISAANPHPPTPGILIQLAHDSKEDSDTASEAWGEVQRAIWSHGSTSIPDHLPERTMAAVRAAGGEWQGMCRDLQKSQVPALRARFIEAYNSIEQRERRREIASDADALLSLARPLAKAYTLVDAKERKG